ncbi:hypothetical protein EON63_15935 [archaeon]|nr:MAG: hypothetical protein EON63_15935 [archaeon]
MPAPAISDNTCRSIVHDTVKLKKFKAIDMRYHWIRNCANMGHLAKENMAGKENMADYFTKIYSERNQLGIRRRIR